MNVLGVRGGDMREAGACWKGARAGVVCPLLPSAEVPPGTHHTLPSRCPQACCPLS